MATHPLTLTNTEVLETAQAGLAAHLNLKA